MDALKWDDLRVFLAVARGGTLASAAEVLGVNPSTVHRRIATLEADLEAQLFERDPRGYALTGVGEALLPKAHEVEEAILAVRRTATGHDRTAQGPVSLTLPETLLPIVAPQLAAVREACPGLRPVLVVRDAILTLGAEADVALRPSSTPPPSAVGRKLGRIGWAVYGPAHDENEQEWVTYTDDAGPVATIHWRRKHHAHVPVLMEVSSVGAMHRVLCCTRARGLLPCYLGDPEPKLSRRSEVIPEASVDLWLLIHADLRRSARVRALVDLLTPRLQAAAPLFSGEV
ncbi:MAG: LysR family transcriptional regulator [Bradymonadia bacterium]